MIDDPDSAIAFLRVHVVERGPATEFAKFSKPFAESATFLLKLERPQPKVLGLSVGVEHALGNVHNFLATPLLREFRVDRSMLGERCLEFPFRILERDRRDPRVPITIRDDGLRGLHPVDITTGFGLALSHPCHLEGGLTIAHGLAPFCDYRPFF